MRAHNAHAHTHTHARARAHTHTHTQVLASNDKDEMEEALLAALSSPENPLDLLGTEVLFRHGNTLAEHDLSKVAAPYARAIIALSEGPDPDAADSRMVSFCFNPIIILSNSL